MVPNDAATTSNDPPTISHDPPRTSHDPPTTSHVPPTTSHDPPTTSRDALYVTSILDQPILDISSPVSISTDNLYLNSQPIEPNHPLATTIPEQKLKTRTLHFQQQWFS